MKIKKVLKSRIFQWYTQRFNYVLIIVLGCASCSKSAIFVSTDGNDLYPGSEAKPVATIGKALELSRRGTSKNIIIREGRYYEVSCKLSAIDSGLQISGEQGKKVYLFGGKKLSNWKKEGDWVVADAPGTADRSWDFRILIVNDTLRTRARLRETGAFIHKKRG